MWCVAVSSSSSGRTASGGVGRADRATVMSRYDDRLTAASKFFGGSLVLRRKGIPGARLRPSASSSQGNGELPHRALAIPAGQQEEQRLAALGAAHCDERPQRADVANLPNIAAAQRES